MKKLIAVLFTAVLAACLFAISAGAVDVSGEFEDYSSEDPCYEESSFDAPSEESSSDAPSEDIPAEPEILLGDVNGDGEINSLDAARVLKHDALLITLEGDSLLAADFNEDGDVNSLDSTLILRIDAGLSIESCKVYFVDWDGTPLGSRNVFLGDAAVPPADPVREGYDFLGWAPSLTNVQGETTFTATYDIEKHTVTYVDYDGTVLSEQRVRDGWIPLAPADPVRDGYVFTGWSPDLTVVTEDVVITATYQKVYKVEFVDYDGSIIETIYVPEGGLAWEPVNPVRDGYEFTGWDKSVGFVYEDMVIHATYAPLSPEDALISYICNRGVYDNGAYYYGTNIETPDGYSFTAAFVYDFLERDLYIVSALGYDDSTETVALILDLDGESNDQQFLFEMSASYIMCDYYGYIKANSFNLTTPVSYAVSYDNVPSDNKAQMKSLAEDVLSLTVSTLDAYLAENGAPVSFSDLGFDNL